MAGASIRSSQNKSYRHWRELARHPEDNNCPWVPVEGPKTVRDLANSRSIELLLTRSDSSEAAADLRAAAKEWHELPSALWKGLSDVRTPQGVLAFFAKPTWTWEQMPDLSLYLDGIQDPGNLGTLLRSAHALGPAGIVCSQGCVSAFNRKVVRASAGALFRVPFLQGIDAEELGHRGYRLWAAQPRSGKPLSQLPWADRSAVLIGAEGKGLSEQALSASQNSFHIPMSEQAESLNAALAGAIVLYEARRGRTP